VIRRYQKQAIATARVMEELIANFKEGAERGASAGLNLDEIAFCDALANKEESVRE
jgi:hypothetical protein